MMGRQPFRKGNILLRQRKSVSGSQKLSEKSKCSTVNHAANERQYKQTNVVVQGSLSLLPRGKRENPRDEVEEERARSRVSDFNLVSRVSLLPKRLDTLGTKLF